MYKRNALAVLLGTLIIGAQGQAFGATFDENAYGLDRTYTVPMPSPMGKQARSGGPGLDENTYGLDRTYSAPMASPAGRQAKSGPPGFDENAFGIAGRQGS